MSPLSAHQRNSRVRATERHGLVQGNQSVSLSARAVFGEDDDDAISFQGNLTVYTESADVYDASNSSFDFAAGANRLHDLITRHKRTTGSTLLDVACGTGTYLTHLGDRYTVEGVDLSPAMLAIAKRKLPNVPLHEADMVELISVADSTPWSAWAVQLATPRGDRDSDGPSRPLRVMPYRGVLSSLSRGFGPMRGKTGA